MLTSEPNTDQSSGVAMAIQQHGQGIGLLAGGAGRAPDAQVFLAAPLRQEFLDQEIEMPLLAEEIGFVGGDQVDGTLALLGALFACDECVVLAELA
jgi:hypothetical protein